MRGAADRQQLGDALDHAEDRHLQPGQLHEAQVERVNLIAGGMDVVGMIHAGRVA